MMRKLSHTYGLNGKERNKTITYCLLILFKFLRGNSFIYCLQWLHALDFHSNFSKLAKSPKEFRAKCVQRQPIFHSSIHAFDFSLTEIYHWPLLVIQLVYLSFAVLVLINWHILDHLRVINQVNNSKGVDDYWWANRWQNAATTNIQ